MTNQSHISQELIHWFWSHGNARVERFALAVDTWLDRAYQAHAMLDSIAASQNSNPCMALWGPSQSGKSTLISAYVDAGGDDLGNGSSLHWPGGVPARFVAKDRDVGAVVLNPVHIGIDASGCVSRFVLRDTVPDPMHPVEVRLATPAQIMHALAIGYLSECVVQDSQGQKTYFSPESFRKRVEALYPPQSKGPGARRDAYEELHRFVDLLELLINSELPRYENLKSDWLVLRRELLSNGALSSSRQNVQGFANEILWDGNKALSEMYQQFVLFREKLVKGWSGKPVFCSLKVASALLDIQGCKQIRDAALPSATADEKMFSRLALAISYATSSESIQGYTGVLVASQGREREELLR